MESSTEDSKIVNIRIPFQSAREAQIAYDVLRVDKEPKRTNVIKTLELDNSTLKIRFESDIAKNLRVAVNGFFDNLILCTETLKTFGPPLSDEYSHN